MFYMTATEFMHSMMHSPTLFRTKFAEFGIDKEVLTAIIVPG